MTTARTTHQYSFARLIAGLILVLSVTTAMGCKTSVKPSSADNDLHNIKPIVKPPTVIAADPGWFACQVDRDCTVEEGVCGIDQAVNKNFTTQFFSYRDDMERSVGCIDKATGDPVHTARCVHSRCTLNPTDHQP